MNIKQPSSLPALSPLPVIYDDGDILAVHKPSGTLSHPNTSTKKRGQTRHAVSVPFSPGRQAGKSAFLGNYDFRDRRFDAPGGGVWLIHRLDQDASGILLATRQVDTARKMRRIFEEQKIEKDYVVLLLGRPRPFSGVWRDALGERRETGRVRAFAMKSGRSNAELQYHVDESFNYGGETFSLVQIRLMSGKTHQIRVQAASRTCPVAGDEIYGIFSMNRRLKKEIGLRRLFLHAFHLSFLHPKTGQTLEIVDPLPDDLEAPLLKLGSVKQ